MTAGRDGRAEYDVIIAGPITTHEAGANRGLTWSESNLDEVEKGWVKRGDSLAN